MLLGLLMSSPSAYAETFIAVHNGAWDQPSTWKDGIEPSSSLVGKNDTVIIPSHVQVLQIDSTLDSSGNIIVNGTWLSEMGFVNEQDGSIKVGSSGLIEAMANTMIMNNNGKIYNAGVLGPCDASNSGIINNTGSFSTGCLEDSGTYNSKDGTIVNYSNMSLSSSDNEGTLVNHGNMWIDGPTSFNSGKMNNTGFLTITASYDPSVDSFVNSGIINNFKGGNVTLDISSSTTSSGIIQNDGIIENSRLLENNGYMINSAIGLINNTGTIRNNANIDNLGIIDNQKVIDNTKTGIINNIGKIKNFGEIHNAGTLSNSNMIDNAGVITILKSGRLVNSAYINNSNVVHGEKGKIINSSGTLINAGLMR